MPAPYLRVMRFVVCWPEAIISLGQVVGGCQNSQAAESYGLMGVAELVPIFGARGGRQGWCVVLWGGGGA